MGDLTESRGRDGIFPDAGRCCAPEDSPCDAPRLGLPSLSGVEATAKKGKN